ncbi:MAG TPA: hypothetical protein ENJ90_01020 [Devosia sp.]|nr:hypothetical protein [Devosia sp.]
MSANLSLPPDSGASNAPLAEEGKPASACDIVEALIGPVLVDPPVLYPFKGAVQKAHAIAVWNWLIRDINPDFVQEAARALSPQAMTGSRSVFPLELADAISRACRVASKDEEALRRLCVQIGGDEVYQSLDQIQNALRHHQLLPQAVAFGRAINNVHDEEALALALNSFPVNDPAVAALMMHAALGPVKSPYRLVSVILGMADAPTQQGIEAAGLGPVVEAILAHAQNQLGVFTDSYGKFADIDLACRALDRFNRLIVAVSIITQNDRNCLWGEQASGLIREISGMIEPRLARLDSDIRVSLRKPRTGADRTDPELILDALNGLYLLVAVKAAKESLALNSIVSTLWATTGRDLETLMSRSLEAFRKEPQNPVLLERLNAGIKMAEVRFNPEYAAILIRARDTAVK